MHQVKIFHNPRCRHSRNGLTYLKGKTGNISIRNYLVDFPTIDELKEVFLKINLKPEQLARNQEPYFKRYMKEKKFTEDEWIKIFFENPKLLQRPIVVGKYKAVIGNPPEQIDKVL